MKKAPKHHSHRVARFNKQLNDTGKWLLEIAEDIHYRISGLDTAVRDDVYEGLARIVHAGNDCMAANLDLTTDQWMSFIDSSTADWFRRRGFAEWFCIAAAGGFRKSRPRDLAERVVRVRRVRRKRKRAHVQPNPKKSPSADDGLRKRESDKR